MAKPIKHGNNWRIRPLNHTGERQSFIFSTHTDALSYLKQYDATVERIKLGLESPSPTPKSFHEAANEYLRLKSSQKKNPKDDKSIITKHLIPFFGKMPLSQVESFVDEFKLNTKHLSDKTLHNILTLLITILRFSFDKRWLIQEPRIKKPKLTSAEFSYLKTDEEIKRFLFAAKDYSSRCYYLYAAAIYTGLRAGELAALKWTDIDFTKRLIKVDKSFEDTTKNNKIRYVPILDVLLPYLIEWRKQNPDSQFIFPSTTGTILLPSAYIFQENLQRVLEIANFKPLNANYSHYITFHDLRHTFASHWMMNGGDIFKLQKILGHSDLKMTQLYAHLEPRVFENDYAIFGTSTLNASLKIAKVRE